MTRLQAFSDILCALALTVLSAVAAASAGALAPSNVPELLVVILQGALVLSGLYLLLKLRSQGWRDLGLIQIRKRDLWRGLQALGIMFLANMVLMLLVYRLRPSLIDVHAERLSAVGSLLNEGSSFLALALSMLFVGFYEEILARGFLLDRCQRLVGGANIRSGSVPSLRGQAWVPVLLSAVLFGLGHFYQGVLGVLQTTLLGIVFASLVIRWQSLWPVILAHASINTLSLGLMRQLESQGLASW